MAVDASQILTRILGSWKRSYHRTQAKHCRLRAGMRIKGLSHKIPVLCEMTAFFKQINKQTNKLK